MIFGDILPLSELCSIVVASSLQTYKMNMLSNLPEDVILLILDKLQEMGCLQEVLFYFFVNV